MGNRTAVFVLAVLALTACDNATQPTIPAAPSEAQLAAATTTQHQTIPFTAVFIGCAETIYYRGTYEFLSHSTVTRNNRHSKWQLRIKAVATSQSGDRYVINQVENITVNAADWDHQGAYNSTRVFKLNVVGQGGAPNFRIKHTIQFTVNANGVITADVFHHARPTECS